MKLAHVALSVGDLDKSVAFYRRIFGLACKEKYRHPDTGLTIALLKKGAVALELFQFKKHKGLPQYRKAVDSDLRTLGVKHFSLKAKDICAVYRRFKKARVAFASGISFFDSGKRYFFIKDPDGILIEVMEA